MGTAVFSRPALRERVESGAVEQDGGTDIRQDVKYFTIRKIIMQLIAKTGRVNPNLIALFQK